MEEGNGQVEAPPQTSGGSSVPFAAENQLALLPNNEPEVEIARAYVTKVMETCMARNDTLMCKRFLRLVTDLHDRGVNTDEVTTCITELFQGTYINLIIDFNEFAKTVNHLKGDLDKRQPATTLPEEDLDKRQREITLSEQDLDKRQPAITLPEEDLDDRQKAIIFNGKVKELGQRKYNAFRMILHSSNNHSKTIKEVHEMATWLFKDRSDLVQEFKTLLPDTSINPNIKLMLAEEPGQQQPRPPRKLTIRVDGKQYCRMIEGERKVPGESSRHGEPARPADKARKGKEKLNIENSKENNMRKRKERNWEEGRQRIASGRQLISCNDGDRGVGSPEPESWVLERIVERGPSSNNGSDDDGFLHDLDRMSERIANMRQLLFNDGGRAVGSQQLEGVPKRIAKVRQLSSEDEGKAAGPSKCIANKRRLISSSKDGGRAAGCPQHERMSTRLKRPTQRWKDQNLKAKAASSPSPPSLQQLPTTAELVERLNKCRPRRAESVEYAWYNWHKDEEL